MQILNILDLVLQDIMRQKGESLSFVQIGAHDGIHLDPVRPYVERYGWRGILVEPQPRIFRKLTQNYKDFLHLKFENVAITWEDGPATMNIFKDESLPEHSTMLASFIPAAITNNTHGYGNQGTQLAVKGITLETLFSKHKIEALDFFQIDAEGFDFEIIKMLAKTAIRPTAINFEHAFYGQRQLHECYSLLANMGYRLASYGVDTIAYLQPENVTRHIYKERPEIK